MLDPGNGSGTDHVPIIPSFDHIISPTQVHQRPIQQLGTTEGHCTYVVVVVVHATLHCHDGIHHSTVGINTSLSCNRQ